MSLAIDIAREANLAVAYDTSYRARLWPAARGSRSRPIPARANPSTSVSRRARPKCSDSSPAARMRYEELRTCSQTACPDQQDQTCRCEAECIFGPGACAELQDMCAEGATDITCDKCM